MGSREYDRSDSAAARGLLCRLNRALFPLLRSLSDFTKQHSAAHWAGTFAEFLEGVFPADARGISRSSHQYMWDMMRAEPALFQDELYGIDDTIERVSGYFKAAASGSDCWPPTRS